MKNIGFPKNEGCTRNFLGRGSVSLHQPRASFTNITAEPYKIRASKASVDDVGAATPTPHKRQRTQQNFTDDYKKHNTNFRRNKRDCACNPLFGYLAGVHFSCVPQGFPLSLPSACGLYEFLHLKYPIFIVYLLYHIYSDL